MRKEVLLMTFAKNNLRKIMKEKEISGLKLSKITDIAPATISGIVNNRLIPFAGWKKRISEALDVPEVEIFPGQENIIE